MSRVWAETTLGKETSLSKGVTYSASDYCSPEDGLPFLTIKCIRKGGGFAKEGLKYYSGNFSPSQVLRAGDLVIALTDLTRAGDIIGSPMLVPDFGIDKSVLPSMDIAVLRPAYAEANLSFIYYRLMLHDARRFMVAYAAGTTVLHLETQAVPNFRFQAPEPKHQAEIAEILSTVDEAIEQTEALIAKTQQIKAGLMHDLFTRGVTSDGRLRPPREEAPHLYKESPLGWIPKEWRIVSFRELASFPSGQVDPRERPYLDWPLVAPDHVESRTGRLLFSESAAEQGAISGKYVFSPGDVVYSKIRPYLRKAILASSTGLCSADMYPLRPTSDILPKYLHEFLLQEHFSRYAEAVSMRSGFPKINRDELLRYQGAVAKTEEQESIVHIGQSLDEYRDALLSEFRKLGQLKQGLMHDLLTGRVRVPVKPPEEALEVAAHG